MILIWLKVHENMEGNSGGNNNNNNTNNANMNNEDDDGFTFSYGGFAGGGF